MLISFVYADQMEGLAEVDFGEDFGSGDEVLEVSEVREVVEVK